MKVDPHTDFLSTANFYGFNGESELNISVSEKGKFKSTS